MAGGSGGVEEGLGRGSGGRGEGMRLVRHWVAGWREREREGVVWWYKVLVQVQIFEYLPRHMSGRLVNGRRKSNSTKRVVNY